MAKYSKRSQDKVRRSMEEMKEGKLKSGRSGKKVTNPKQAIAIGLSEARAEGAKVPRKKAAKKAARKGTKKAAKKAAPRKTARKSAKKAAPRKSASRRTKKSAPKKAARKKSSR